jgi:protease-4
MIVSLFVRLISAFFRALFWPLLYLRFRRAGPKGSYLAIDIEGPVVDIRPPATFLDRFRKQPASLAALSELADAVIEGTRVRGIVVTLGSFHQGMASALSLHNVLRRVRESGREVILHLPLGGGTKELYVASAATRIFAAPQTTLAPLGFLVTARYLRRALDKAGLVPEVYARGVYKSAGDQLLREGMSEKEREQQDAILDHLYESLVAKIAEGRRVSVERARAIIDGAPYLHNEAIEQGLIDGAAYQDEVPTAIGVGKPARVSSAARYIFARRALRFPAFFPERAIGVIEIHGAITGASPLAAELGLATDEGLIGAVRTARSDPRIRAVVLHINSPGGGALASDRIHHELVALAAEKPLIAYMANVAASGGYYVAAAAHTIIAQPTTITGSIGVVAARFAIDPVLERLGITTEVLKRGAHADLIAPTRALRDDERAVIERELEGMYRAFLKAVADGRKQPVESIAKVAEGRVWIGQDAKGVGLVDELGGFDVAVEAARARLGKTQKGASKLRPAIVRPPRRRVPPLKPPSAAGEAERPALAILRAYFPQRSALLDLLHLARQAGADVDPAALLLCGERVLAWCPEARSLARDG